mgnify:CR=1 FL=1
MPATCHYLQGSIGGDFWRRRRHLWSLLTSQQIAAKWSGGWVLFGYRLVEDKTTWRCGPPAVSNLQPCCDVKMCSGFMQTCGEHAGGGWRQFVRRGPDCTLKRYEIRVTIRVVIKFPTTLSIQLERLPRTRFPIARTINFDNFVLTRVLGIAILPSNNCDLWQNRNPSAPIRCAVQQFKVLAESADTSW